MIFRRRYIISALAICAIVAIGTAPWPIDHLPFGEQLEHRFVATTGMALTRKRATLTLLPSPTIELHQVTISQTPSDDPAVDNSLLRAPNVQVRLKIRALLSGSFEADNVILNTPRIRWTGPEQPSDLWTMVHRFLPAVDNYALPTQLSIVDGTVLHESGASTLLRRLNASLAWPAQGSPLYLSATAMWHGEAIDLRLEKFLPQAVVEKRTSPLSVRFSARPLSVSFNGEVSADDTSTIAGDLSMSTRSFGRAIAWLRIPFSFADDTGPIAIKGTMRLSSEGFSIPDTTIETAGGTLEGAVGARVTEAQRMLISATLDTKKLDLYGLSKFIYSPASGSGWETGTWLAQTIKISNDLDIRFSAAEASFGKLALQDVAANILVMNNKLELSLNQARFNDGTMKARLQIAPSLDTVTTRLTGTFDGIATNEAIQNLFSVRFLSGLASGQVALEGVGQSPERIAQTITGTITAHIAEGDLIGVDLASVLRRARLRPLATALDWRGGQSSFTDASVSMRIYEGIGELDGGFRFKDNLIGKLSGTIGIADRTLALRLHVDDAADPEMPTEERPSVGFPIEISGPWDYPIVTPDIQMLIERSSTTSPAPPSNTP